MFSDYSCNAQDTSHSGSVRLTNPIWLDIGQSFRRSSLDDLHSKSFNSCKSCKKTTAHVRTALKAKRDLLWGIWNRRESESLPRTEFSLLKTHLLNDGKIERTKRSIRSEIRIVLQRISNFKSQANAPFSVYRTIVLINTMIIRGTECI